MKIITVEILPSWNVLIAANTENNDMPMSSKQEDENRKCAYNKLTIRVFHSMGAGVFFFSHCVDIVRTYFIVAK